MAGGAFYDDVVTAEYLAHRHGGIHSPNTVMEEPALLEAIGHIDDADLLDLGCGDGSFAAVALERGARSYLGLDASPSMIDAARRTATGERVSFECMAIEDFDAGGPAYDVVTARMALHYVADLADALGRVHRSLHDGGRFVCTVVHPVITSHDNPRPGPRSDWTVDRYFDDGPRQRQWFGKEVTWYHRTTEQYVRALAAAGFRLETLSECAPAPALLTDHPDELLRRRRVPLILLLGGTKPGTPPLTASAGDLAVSPPPARETLRVNRPENRPLAVLEYDSSWPARFEAIAQDLRQGLGSAAATIDHIGSTSVPGLAAKDIIDIQVTVVDLDAADAWPHELIDGVVRTQRGSAQDHVPPGRSDAHQWAKHFWSGRGVHIHVRELGRLNQRYALLFRDFLRADEVAADAYGALKRALAAVARGDWDAYYTVKDPACDLIIAGAEEWALRTAWAPGRPNA